MRVTRVSYVCENSREIHRWLQHIIEEVILRELDDLSGRELAEFKAVKYMELCEFTQETDSGSEDHAMRRESEAEEHGNSYGPYHGW